jgi:ABC-type transport system involved in multi-copper enzyme maturation permease subunit
MTTAVAPRVASVRLPLAGLGWVTWRQHRVALAGVVALLGGISLFFAIQGAGMHHFASQVGIASCGDINGAGCQTAELLFEQKYGNWAQFLPRFVLFVPGLLGIFVGAPLVAKELESGTFRFAWTQGRTRGRWIVTKLALIAATLVGLSLAFSAAFTWWYAPWLSITGRMSSGQAYEVSGIVFAARTLFAVMLGACLGAIVRRTVASMAATAVVWTAVAWSSVIYLRPLIQAPIESPVSTRIGISTDWTLSEWYQDAAGHHVNSTQLVGLIKQARSSTAVTGRQDFDSWLRTHGYTHWTSYQPDSRFWHFQGIEAAAYVLLALALAGATVWWVRRRAA